MNRRRPPRSAGAEELLTTLQHLTSRARREVELHQARVELAKALQRGMLPSALPALPGLQTAARYSPARNGLDIGGDWYDGFRLPDGSLAYIRRRIERACEDPADVVDQLAPGRSAAAWPSRARDEREGC